MAQSQLGLYNLALQHLGMKKITSISGTDPSTVACNNFYETCLNDAYSEHAWPFATAQATVNASSVTAPLGWTYCYDYPTENCAKVWLVFNEATYDKPDEQDFNTFYDPTTGTRIIASNLEEAYIEYTHIVSDPTLWDTKFYLAMSYKLAASMAHALTGDAQKGLALMQLYNGIIHEAKRVGSSEQRKKPVFSSAYQNSRG